MFQWDQFRFANLQDLYNSWSKNGEFVLFYCRTIFGCLFVNFVRVQLHPSWNIISIVELSIQSKIWQIFLHEQFLSILHRFLKKIRFKNHLRTFIISVSLLSQSVYPPSHIQTTDYLQKQSLHKVTEVETINGPHKL